LAGAAGLAAAAALPLVGFWLRRDAAPGCALDGAKIDPAYRVEVIDGRGRPHALCCLRCAEIWLKSQPTPQAILVTDEASGERIDARDAWYVRSSVVTTPATGNRVHVFRSRADAEKHADEFGGTVLSESERPLR
jgi:hypothetical protein